MECEWESDLWNNPNLLQGNEDELLALEHTNNRETTKLDLHIEEHLNNSNVVVSDTTQSDIIEQSKTLFCSSCGLIDRVNQDLSLSHAPCYNPRFWREIILQTFVCVYCCLEFKSARFLRLHQSTEHADGIYTCRICKELFKNLNEMFLHAKSHNDYPELLEADTLFRIYLCTKENCDEVFTTWSALCQHKQTHCTAHAIEDDKSAFKPRKHKKPPKRSNRTCPTCKGSYKNDRSLRQHISFMHEPVLCLYCMKLIKNRRNLINHERVVHLNMHRYFCKDCNKGFFYQNDVDEHQRKVHTKTIYNCDECTFSTLYEKTMETHEAMHKQMVTHNCPVCSKKFGRKLLLALHMKEHQEKKQFVCSERIVNGCDASFVTNYLLNQHIHGKHSELGQTANEMCHHAQNKCNSNATPLDAIIVEENCNDDTLFNTFIQYLGNADDDVNSADMQELT